MPRGERRRLEIVEVAERLFLANGFADTTMQMVAAEAGASKETLYRHFGNKEELFAEVVKRRAEQLQAPLEQGFARGDGVGEVLRALGTSLLQSMTQPDIVSLLRIVVAEAHRDPALGHIFYAFGPERVIARLTDFFEAARRRGDFVGSDPALAASLFLGAVSGQCQTARLVLRDAKPMPAAEISERVEAVVAMVMRYFFRPGAG